ncbi:MAG: glycogen/starch synthase [Bacteroidales bacterium]|nr:glycogen/starch synthase [Bacteroidales bacterium]
MDKPKILYVSQEIYPYMISTPLADFGRYLPQATFENGKEIRIFMPRFGNVNERKNQLHEVIRLSGLNIIIDDTDHPLIIKVASIPTVRMQIYFIDNEDFFTIKADVKDAKGKFLPNNDERSIFFTRGVLETVKKLSWRPSLIHCSGWFSMLLPFYVRRTEEYSNNPYFSHSKIVVSLFNDPFPGAFDESFIKKIKKETEGGTSKDWKFYKEPTYENIMKAAISYADGVVIAQDKVSKELIDFAKENKKDIIPYNADRKEFYKSINDYYDSVIEIEED